jgi:predicted RNA binding protein YcfA (HicA-like mRNA interferase family)
MGLYKDEHSLTARTAQVDRIKDKYPGRIPVIVERYPGDSLETERTNHNHLNHSATNAVTLSEPSEDIGRRYLRHTLENTRLHSLRPRPELAKELFYF